MAEPGSAVKNDRSTTPEKPVEIALPDLSSVFDQSLNDLTTLRPKTDDQSTKLFGDLTIDDLALLQKAGDEFFVLTGSDSSDRSKAGPQFDDTLPFVVPDGSAPGAVTDPALKDSTPSRVQLDPADSPLPTEPAPPPDTFPPTVPQDLDRPAPDTPPLAVPGHPADPPLPDQPAPADPTELPQPEAPPARVPGEQPPARTSEDQIEPAPPPPDERESAPPEPGPEVAPPTVPGDAPSKPAEPLPALKESANAFGAKVRTDDSGQVREIQRTDGTTVKLSLESSNGRIVETDKNNSVTKTWTLDKSGRWISDTDPKEQRISMQLEPNGNLRFESEDRVPHVITSNGFALVGDAAKNTLFDPQGRIEKVVYPGGRVRMFGYEGSEVQPNHVSRQEPGSSTWTHYKRVSPDTWYQTDTNGKVFGKPWQGQVSVGPEGTYSTRISDPNANWIANRINGQNEHVKIDSNGVELGFDGSDRIATAKRGSSTINATYEDNGKLRTVVETNRKTGEESRWAQSPDGGWRTEDGSLGVRYKLEFHRDGKLSWLDGAGNRFVKPADAQPEKTPSGEGTGDVAKADRIEAPPVRPRDLQPTAKTKALEEQTPKVREREFVETPEQQGLIAQPQDRLSVARDTLATAAKDSGMDVARLNQFMNDFEKRCKNSKDVGNKAPSEEQMAKTYDELTALLKGPGNRSLADRADLAKLTMFNLAYPSHIDQGLNLCNVTTAEVFTASRHPENYAKLIKEVALTGKFTTTDGKQITLPNGSIDRDQENASFTPETVGQNRWRNYASKIFQETGINSVVPFLEPNSNYPAWGKPHVSGKSDMAMPQIQAAVEAINGEKMPYFGVSDAPTAAELLKLKEDGNFPAGVHTIHVQQQDGVVSGLHVQTIQDIRMRDGQLQVLLDNQRGGTNDQGWVSLKQMHDVQQLYNLGPEWYQIPAQYQGRTFDSLAPKRDSSAPPLQRPEHEVKPQQPQVEPPKDGGIKPDVEPEKKVERPQAATEPGALETRRLLEEALIKGIKGPLGDIRGPVKANREAKAKEILDSFEKRCSADRKAGLVAPSEAQITRAYKAALDTLNEEGVMPYADRHKMVLEGLRNVSDPLGLDQGDHGSCGNTCAEKYIASRNPDVYMDALRQVAKSGKYTAPDGRVLTLPYDDVRQGQFGNRTMTWQRGWKPDGEAKDWDVYKEKGWHPLNSNESRRNYASQIMQNLNLADALESARLKQRGEPAGLDGLNFLHVEDFTKRLTGKPITTINQRIQTEGNIMQPLTDELALQLKRDGRLPAMVFRAYHWQTIHDVRTVPGTDAWNRPANVVQVLSDNQWGNKKDRGWVTVPQLHQELSEPGY